MRRNMPNQFEGHETFNLSGSGITFRDLEIIVKLANENGRIAIINIGPTSFLELALSLLAYAKKHEEKVNAEL
jgi:hypothetical protein